MTSGVKRMYEEALDNDEFNACAEKADPEGYIKPGFWASDVDKHIYTSVYYGWLVGRDRFKKSNYYPKDN
jgi:hypothetical protein